MYRIFMLFVVCTAVGAIENKAHAQVLGKTLATSPYKFDHKDTIWHASSLSLPLFKNKITARTDHASCGLQYQNFYIGAQLDTLSSLQPALEKIQHFDNMRGAHLTSGGIRVGGFISPKTMVYVKAGFTNQQPTFEPRKNHVHSEKSQALSSSFAPSIGFEWQMPHKLSVAGEIRTAFGRNISSSEPRKRQSGTVLFNVRYQFDNKQ